MIYYFCYLISLLPFGVLYVLSDILCFFVKLFGYRKKVILRNLRNSFPEKTDAEIRRLLNEFYAYFTDLMLETVKTLSMTEKDFRQRMVFLNVEEIDARSENKQNMVLYLAHYGNWEWLNFGRVAFAKQKQYLSYSVYHQQSSSGFDEFMQKLRQKAGCILVPQEKVPRFLVQMRSKEDQRGFLCLIADQSPMWSNTYFWMDFLNQETAPIVGPERIARQTKWPVYYLEVKRIKRGYYTAEFKLLVEDPMTLPEKELTKIYMRTLEQQIKENPVIWLWSHNRWKRKKEDMPTNYDKENKIK